MNIKISVMEKLINHLKENKIKEIHLRTVGGNDQWYTMKCDGYEISIPASTNDKGTIHTNRMVQEDIK